MGGCRDPRKCDGTVRKLGAASGPPCRWWDHGIASHETHYVEWNLQAERRCPQDDRGWLIIRQQGIKVTVQHRVIIAPEMKLRASRRSTLGEMYQKETPVERSKMK